MNEWGIPDWKDQSNYQICGDWEYNRWRWEFLRRREDYRRAFATLAPYSHEQWSKRAEKHKRDVRNQLTEHNSHPSFNDPPPIDSADFVAEPVWGETALFDYVALPNPRYSDVPSEHIEPIHRTLDQHLRLIETDDLQLLCHSRGQVTGVLPRGYVAIRFDLGSPISPQLKGLKGYLIELAKENHVKAEKRNRVDKWPTYLRFLDGRNAGASWSELTSILPDWMSSKTPQSARDVCRQAEQVQSDMWLARRQSL